RSDSRSSNAASRRWDSCLNRDSRDAIAASRFVSLSFSFARFASAFSIAARRDSMSCRSARRAVSCSSRVVFRDSRDPDLAGAPLPLPPGFLPPPPFRLCPLRGQVPFDSVLARPEVFFRDVERIRSLGQPRFVGLSRPL